MADTIADRADLDVIAKDIAVLRKDIGVLLRQMKNGTTEAATDELRSLYESLASEGEHAVSALTQKVEERPFTSLLIAFAAGFIGSRFLPP